MSHKQIGPARVGFQLVQQVVDALRQLQHTLAAIVAVSKISLGEVKFCAIAGRALVLAEALLPQARLAPGGQTCGVRNGLCRIGGTGQRRVKDLVDVHTAGLDGFAQLPCLLTPLLGQRAVGHPADLVFNVPHGLAVTGKIEFVHKNLFCGSL